MRISDLTLKNFRSYEDLGLSFGPGINVLYGKNGRGKTNVIEAIFLATCARSHRHAKDQDMITFDHDYYEVALHFYPRESYQEHLLLRYLKAKPSDPDRKVNRRLIFHDGLQLPRVADLPGIFNAVIFAPEDLMMVKEGPATRRQFLDLLLSQVRPSYFAALQGFAKHLRQRNALLKQIRDERFRGGSGSVGWDLPLLDISDAGEVQLPDTKRLQLRTWNQQYAKFAAEIIAERRMAVARLEKFAQDFHYEMSGGQEHLKLRYRTVGGLAPDAGMHEIYEHLLQRLNETEEDDIERGFTFLGPHRDDLEFRLDDMPLKVFGSQGQQRSVVLSLKMAELKMLKEDTKRSPVLLLDDVMSELDAGRRKALINAMADCQVFITCTDPEQIRSEWLAYDPTRELHFYHVTRGAVQEVDEAKIPETLAEDHYPERSGLVSSAASVDGLDDDDEDLEDPEDFGDLEAIAGLADDFGDSDVNDSEDLTGSETLDESESLDGSELLDEPDVSVEAASSDEADSIDMREASGESTDADEAAMSDDLGNDDESLSSNLVDKLDEDADELDDSDTEDESGVSDAADELDDSSDSDGSETSDENSDSNDVDESEVFNESDSADDVSRETSEQDE